MLKEAAAELLGTFVLIVFGVGVVAQTVLSRSANGSYLAINLGWGLGVMLGVYTAARVSGAHLNPAVTVALAARRGFPWSKVPVFAAAQTAGAFLAAAVVLTGIASVPAATKLFPVDELQPGMVGVGQTVFEGDRLDQFTVHILGVLRNVIGPRR